MQVGFTHSNQESTQEVFVDKNEFYFKEEINELIISENGGSIRAQVDDDCLILKVIQKIPHASLEGAPLQESSTYFMEVGEKLTYRESSFELSKLDNSASIEIQETQTEENEEQIIAEEPKEEITTEEPVIQLNEISGEVDQENSSEDESSIEFEESTVVEEPIGYQFQVDENPEPEEEKEKDSGTMSITQVLNVAKLQEEQKSQEDQVKQEKKAQEHVSRPLGNKKAKKKASKKTNKKVLKKPATEEDENYGLKGVTSARDYKGNRKKRDAAKKASAKKQKQARRGLDGENLVGPFTRFLCGISLVFVTILFSSQVENEAIESLSQKGTNLINLELAKYIDFSINQEITKSLILLMLILLISNILFSVSPTLFICGATTKGSFLMKRIKALFRTPFDFIAHFIPIFEVPVIFDTPSLKEIITRGAISYRLRVFKFIPLIILPVFVGLSIGYPVVQQGLKVKNPPKKVNLPKQLGKRPMKFKELLISKKFSQENIILRVPTLRPSYLILNKESGRTLLLKNTTSTFFVSFKKTLESIPFFKYRYPYLSSFLKEENSSFLVREDFGKILWGGEIIKGMATDDLLYIDFLAINQSKKIFNHFKLPYIEYRNLNKFSSFYRSKLEEVYLYIGEDSLMQFTKTGGTMRSSELEGLSFLARPKVKIEHFDAVEKAANGVNETFLIELMTQARDITRQNGNDENTRVLRDFTQLLVEYLKSSDKTAANQAAKNILELNILNN